MSQIYIEYQFVVSPLEPGVEILIAELGYAGFESFVETPNGMNAFIQKQDWHHNMESEVFILKNPG